MLRNERYRGVFVWNRTQKRRNPETERKTSRRRPESEWRRVDVPEWKIVSDQVWDSVQRRFADVRRIGITRCGGLARSQKSRKYLFGGLLRCGCCDSRMVIVSGEGKRGYSKYGCPTNRYRGVFKSPYDSQRSTRSSAFGSASATSLEYLSPDLHAGGVGTRTQETCCANPTTE